MFITFSPRASDLLSHSRFKLLLLWPLFLITVGQLCYKWGNLACLVGPVDHGVQLDKTIDAFLP